jgi:hypothetical protein
MWVLIRPPRFGGANHAGDHSYKLKYRNSGLGAEWIVATPTLGKVVREQANESAYCLCQLVECEGEAPTKVRRQDESQAEAFSHGRRQHPVQVPWWPLDGSEDSGGACSDR